MDALTTVTYMGQSARFLECLENADHESLPTAQQFIMESQYRAAEIGESFKDLSFCILEGQTPKTFILAHKFDDFIGFNGSGVEVVEAEYDKKRSKFIFQHLLDSAAQEDCSTLKIDDCEMGHMLSPLGQDIFNYKASPDLKLRATQDLSLSESAIFSGIRKSYRNLINTSKKEIKFTYMTSENVDKALFDEFRLFHKKTAGRQTRPIASWDAQFEMIKAGDAELVMGYMPPHGLVSSALFTDYGHTTSYAVAVYDRALFDKPLAHANVFEGMIRAKSRGKKHFNLGIVPLYNPKWEKEFNIGMFKKGFCRNLSSFIEWTIPLS